MIKRTAAALATALVLAIGGTGTALASNGADDPPGHHHEHGNGHKHHGHHGKHHLHAGKVGGETKAPQETTPPMSEYGY